MAPKYKTPKSLRRYIVDRADGMTSDGLVRVVVLVLIDADGRETSVCMSKTDAMMMAQQLQALAIEVQRDVT